MNRSGPRPRAGGRAVALFLMMLAVPVWSACGGAAPQGAAPRATAPPPAAKPAAQGTAASTTQLIPVNVAWVAVTTHTLPTWIAETEGLFRAQGLDAHVSYIHGSVTATAAMMSGGLDIIEEAPSTSVEARLKGADTVVLATHIPYADQVLVAGPKATGIRTMADLRGATVGLTKAGDVTDMLMRLALEKAGLVPQKDVHLLYTGGQPAQLAALQTGAVQAVLLSPPNDLTAEAAGGHQIIDLSSLHLPFPEDGVVSTQSFVKAHPQVVVDYLKAYLEAIRFIKAHPAQTEAVLANYTHETNKAVLQHAYQLLVGIMPNDPVPTTAGIETVLGFLPNGKGKNPADFIDPQPLAAAAKALGS